MTATDTTTHDHDHAHDHPSDKRYVFIAIVLALLTAVEIVMFVIEEWLTESFGSGFVKIGLIVLMIIKFWIVGAFFMHLKFDKPILWQLFAAGLILAIAVYWIMLSAFEFNFWNDGFEDTGFWEGQEDFLRSLEDES